MFWFWWLCGLVGCLFVWVCGCGCFGVGGGGGSKAGGSDPVVYNVPWSMWDARKAPQRGLVVYWFPASNNEVEKSSLRHSRILTLYAAQCVTMTVADAKTPELQKIIGDSALPVAVLATADG